MAGVLIYKSALNQHYSFLSVSDDSYEAEREDIPNRGDKILWEKGNVTPEQIQNARETKNTLVARLNAGIKVDLEKELESFFE
ncbi:MAG: hypothetical protein AABY32_06190 [Nanoarchaeota archaeon]